MKLGLFIPCYINQLYPHVAVATFELLKKLGVEEIEYPLEQTCCGQPLANSGFVADARKIADKFVSIFSKYDYVVCPSGSCTSMVKNHYPHLLKLEHKIKIMELSEFIYDVLGIKELKGKYQKKIAFHQSCHGLRELRLASSSERVCTAFGKTAALLRSIKGIELVELKRKDECCGFGGTFAVSEEALSIAMGDSRIEDHLQAGAEEITAIDMSCLMHLQGIVRREKIPLTVRHIAEIFNESIDASR